MEKIIKKENDSYDEYFMIKLTELWPHSSSVINMLHFDTILMLLILSLDQQSGTKMQDSHMACLA